MSEERTITPRPYVYGKLDQHARTALAVYVDGVQVVNTAAVSRYYIGRDGLTLAVFERGSRSVSVRIVWSATSARTVLYVNGKTTISRDVRFMITENGQPVTFS